MDDPQPQVGAAVPAPGHSSSADDADGAQATSTVQASLSTLLADDLDRGFEAMVDATRDRLFSGILRLVGDRATADDLTQDTYVLAYRALRDWPATRRQELRVHGWLWTIARNVVRSHHRRRGRRPAVTDGPPPEAPDDRAVRELEAGAERADSDRDWARRLGRLSPSQREAVVLRHVVGLTYPEIAAAVERPPATVRSDVHRGLRALRAVLDEEERE